MISNRDSTITLKLANDGKYELADQNPPCQMCLAGVSSESSLHCTVCNDCFHRNCASLRQISNNPHAYTCLTCLIAAVAEGSALAETANERYDEVTEDVFIRRRQRLSIEQLGVLIDVGENLLPTVFLPELHQLKTELSRALQLTRELDTVS